MGGMGDDQFHSYISPDLHSLDDHLSYSREKRPGNIYRDIQDMDADMAVPDRLPLKSKRMGTF